MSDCAAPASPQMPGTDYDHADGAAVLAEHLDVAAWRHRCARAATSLRR